MTSCQETNRLGVNMSSSLSDTKGKNSKDIVTAFRRFEPGTQPESLFPAYRATIRRAPSQPLIFLPHTLSEVTGPVFGHADVQPTDSDLTRQHDAQPIGERIVVS